MILRLSGAQLPPQANLNHSPRHFLPMEAGSISSRTEILTPARARPGAIGTWARPSGSAVRFLPYSLIRMRPSPSTRKANLRCRKTTPTAKMKPKRPRPNRTSRLTGSQTDCSRCRSGLAISAPWLQVANISLSTALATRLSCSALASRRTVHHCRTLPPMCSGMNCLLMAANCLCKPVEGPMPNS